MNRSNSRLWIVASCLAATAVVPGCVRRTLTITTEPPQALVFLNNQEVGRSTVTTDFIWYGDYEVTIRQEGYKTLKTHYKIDRPWYQVVPLDFFAEVLWPGRIHDAHSAHFELEKAVYPEPEELVSRAKEMRERISPLGK